MASLMEKDEQLEGIIQELARMDGEIRRFIKSQLLVLEMEAQPGEMDTLYKSPSSTLENPSGNEPELEAN